MVEKAKNHTAPYASWTSFLNFINKLQESGVPARIDPSVFGNASGSISYSIIAALKSLKLIMDDGIPTPEFSAFVNSTEDQRKAMMEAILKTGYPSLWNGGIDLATATAGQFDEHLRSTYDVKGSTVDKAAAFFLSAAQFADIKLSAHLKQRKPTASSPSSRKSIKQRKRTDNGGEVELPAREPPRAAQEKPLQYQLIDLMTEPDFPEDKKGPIWELVQYLAERQSKKSAASNDSAGD